MKIKRLIALLCVSLGIFFTGMLILNFWGVFTIQDNSLAGKLVFTCGALSAGFLALLVVLKLMEDKK
ncbi:MAG: hypothetical protein M1127_01290 [Patescibacteria group bacterium]|nr:hypothetical protein [Patescibacteria group bacterium]